MRKLLCTDEPIEIYGLETSLLPEHFYRLPISVMEAANEGVAVRAKAPMGGRVRFRTNSTRILIHMEMQTLSEDWAVPLSCSAGAVVYLGETKSPRLATVICPHNYRETLCERVIEKGDQMEDITVYLPRNEILAKLEFEIDEAAEIQAPTPYAVKKPIVFYGSSITEGGCASRVTSAYPAMVSKWLDADHKNLGFSGAAKGETTLAEYIAGLEMSAFVYDYDHNAPNPQHLADTHEPFFKIIRKAQPELPILILSKPDVDSNPQDAAERRDIVRQTYLNAKAAGDGHVAFIDGHTFFGEHDREMCTVEGCHPNDLGFMHMANAVYPVLQKLMG